MTDPRLAALLASCVPAGTTSVSWLDGAMPLSVAAYTSPAALPDDLITSIRCVTSVGDRVLLCTNAGGSHPWPGGRREAGETHAQTAVREVHEETGWRVDPASLRPLGWLHLRHQAPRRADEASPYPDFLQVVYHGVATSRDVAEDAPWEDVDNYELECRPVSLDEARARSRQLLAYLFLDLL
ncbi:NUDIX domain-containing protein [Labedaea rhizosphaerae]|uniref:NUDIX domain-containing protein n=1 Tax=Labedaea rhizosphaerae TaxID=598644 RepID=A0A4R6S5P6_LABRH|nr:NUDIX domain-containing protein [Labedaea rhizosphaerae]TDP94086.1 NUDIX domain-containing protein [Labedaea rhizosphaerae]